MRAAARIPAMSLVSDTLQRATVTSTPSVLRARSASAANVPLRDRSVTDSVASATTNQRAKSKPSPLVPPVTT